MKEIAYSINGSSIQITEKNLRNNLHSLSTSKILNTILHSNPSPSENQICIPHIYKFIKIEKSAVPGSYEITTATKFNTDNISPLSTSVVHIDEIQPFLESLLFGVNDNNKATVSYTIPGIISFKAYNTKDTINAYMNTLSELALDPNSDGSILIERFIYKEDCKIQADCMFIVNKSNVNNEPKYQTILNDEILTLNKEELENKISDFCGDYYTLGMVLTDCEE